MLILLGYLVVLGTVFGGYLMTGGSLGALYQPAELVIIAGAGIGSFIVGNNGKAIKGTLKALPLLFRRSKYTKAMYMDLLALLYRLMAKSRQMGMFSLERDIENPRESEIFASYPRILADSVMLDFIVDYLRLIISGHMNTFEIEALMDEEIETHESEAEVPANSLALVGDSLPAFGIVAAVMGVVHALGSADRPAAELGRLSLMRWWGLSSVFYWLTDLFPISECFTSEKRRNQQNDAVRQSHSAFKSERLRTAYRR